MTDQEKYHISAKDFAKKYKHGELQQVQLIDVREPQEWEIYHLEHSQLIPLAQLPLRLHELDRLKPVYILCAHGVRSWHAANYLLQEGFEQVMNVDGGLAEVSLYLDEDDE
ncbi:rhodanese-like domain-containing protein [Thermoflavimicrobium dichotomicum]|uniref:Rhodanese-related sulfurtransferase n=1 Tax=Thermoflavimicrobium dichotomicum TaxID=46223 RepID=A0A1I3SFW5_9BACL|nr:rhodanese-like domain-containing protein [Thermoflavimicrobium dichotomicum]SFJ57260.1 Rhodanese-related sulfurtransferase [Thermoflavimicrobium dichotomicum]